jgi:FkbM family methyltransferase
LLNLRVGSATDIDGKTCILTRPGASGHAVYGPYRHLDPGHYVAEFNIAPADGELLDGAEICATVDVAANHGRMILARQEVAMSRLRQGPARIRLPFRAYEPASFEFRVGITGRAALLIDDYCPVVPLDSADADFAALLDDTGFPDPHQMPKPAFFLQNLAHLRRFYENGATVKIVDNAVVVTIDGVSFHARSFDDIRFVDEIFFRSTYNFLLGQDCCVIDIGMNLGLVAMTFASKENVKEVYSFEPFPRTYQRACGNLALNPEIASKITAHNFGLADTDGEVTVLISDHGDSGCLSIRGSDRGTPERISVRNAATVLRPIIDAARSKGQAIIAKVDCEGSEFPIFDTFEKNGFFADISAFMVEWHRVFEGKTQHTLFAPLLRSGFIVFDQSGRTGNGFFYAVRTSPLFN